ncbi:MAG TPA: O-antigen ligase family protein, partial [Gemmatimonadaceae bacterium]|nr:O-antigen ligase family protein [Gemmatimonadaceae bacterium]
MTLSIPLGKRSRRTIAMDRSLLPRFTRFDAILLAILFGPLTVLQVAGRTPSLYWVDVILAVLAFTAFAKVAARPSEDSFRVPRVMLWAFAYVLVAGVSMLLSDDVLVSIANLKLRIMPVAAFFLACRYARSVLDIERFFRSVVAFGAALSAVALYNWYRFSSGLQILSEDLGPKDMLQLSFGRSNYLAGILVLIIPTIIAFLRRRKTRASGLAYLGALLIISLALIFAQSRGAMISLALGMIAWGLFGLARRFSIRTVLNTLLGVAAILILSRLLWSRVPEDVRIGLTTAFSILWADALRGNYGGGRTELWVGAIRGALESNLLGIGLGNQAGWYSRAGMTSSAHNLYLETLMETGIVGLFTLLGILAGFAATLWWLWKNCTEREHPMAGAL